MGHRAAPVALCAPPGVYVTPAMRLKSEIWVKAYIRRCQHEGAAAVLGAARRCRRGCHLHQGEPARRHRVAVRPSAVGSRRGARRAAVGTLPRAAGRWPRPRPMPICSGRSRSIPISGSWLSRMRQAGIFSRIGWPRSSAEQIVTEATRCGLHELSTTHASPIRAWRSRRFEPKRSCSGRAIFGTHRD